LMHDMREIFIELKRRGFCDTKLAFQSRWCGVSRDYMAVHKHRRKPPTLAVLFRLYVTLDDHYQTDLAEKVMQTMRQLVKE
jgi:hypothetical protein